MHAQRLQRIADETGGRFYTPETIAGMPEDLRNVDAYLKASQLSVNRQVILEAKILEVELNDSGGSGTAWAKVDGTSVWLTVEVEGRQVVQGGATGSVDRDR